MKRREFIVLAGGVIVTWPSAVLGQQAERMRRVAVVMGTVRDDPQTKPRIAAFVQRLQELGWTEGRNVQIDYRWGAGSSDDMHKHAAELAELAPEAILASGTMSLTHVLQARRTVPIVFALVADPVGAGFVESLSRPGGNATG